MRLWHINMFHVLPREQLVSQWREAAAIAGAIKLHGTPNHILVNFVCDYDFDHFISYCYYLRAEMTKRGYHTMDSVWNKIVSLKPSYTLLKRCDVFKEKMYDSSTYATICYYNLFEKFLCGGIKFSDWQKIEEWYNI